MSKFICTTQVTASPDAGEDITISMSEQSMLNHLETALAAKNIRLTFLRKLVYLIIYRSKNKGITAYQILDFIKINKPKAAPITIYRSLSFLLHNKLIVKLGRKNKYYIRKETKYSEVSIYMICSNCGLVEKITDFNFKIILEDIMLQRGYIPNDDFIEIIIICPKCQ